MLSACFQPAPHTFEVASSQGPVHLEFFIGNRQSRWSFQVEGVTQIDLAALMSVSDQCTDTGPWERMEVDDSETDNVLFERNLVADPICADDRLVWNGDDLVELASDEPWPGEIYDPP